MKRRKVLKLGLLAAAIVAIVLLFTVPVSLLPKGEIRWLIVQDLTTGEDITDALDTEQLIDYLASMKCRHIIETDWRWRSEQERYQIMVLLEEWVDILVGVPDSNGVTTVMNTAWRSDHDWEIGPFRWRYRVLNPQGLVDEIDRLRQENNHS